MEAYKDTADGIAIGESGDTIPTAIIDCTEDSPTMIREGIAELK